MRTGEQNTKSVGSAHPWHTLYRGKVIEYTRKRGGDREHSMYVVQ